MERSGRRLAGNPYQMLAILLCLVLAVAMILNTEMSGEAMWFWYATVFRQGVKLYADLHFALQPLFVLETAAWTRIFGDNLVIYEIPAVFHALFLAVGIYLVLRESDWPEWQKAIVLFSTFVFTVCGHSYRFDDYHVLTEALVIYAAYLLLRIGRLEERESARWELGLAATLGLVCGVTMMTRITDGTALAFASGVSLAVMARRRKLASVAIFIAVVALVVVVVVRLTGDTISAWSSNSIFRAAANKGGTGSIFAAPFGMVRNTWHLFVHKKKLDLIVVACAVGAAWLARRGRRSERWIVPAQVGSVLGLMLLISLRHRFYPGDGFFFEYVAVITTLGMYVLAAAAAVHWVRAWREHRPWDARGVLLLIPICEWASYAAASSAEPILNYYAPAAVVLLLVPVLRPFGRSVRWAELSVVSLMVLLSINGVLSKIAMPYAWQNYSFPTMFTHRQWIHHPVYGAMYMDRWNLDFSEHVCADIGAVPGKTHPELLSLPYPYLNYFCDTPPWHNYVQTFFDTANRAVIDHLMGELQEHPPEWIVYQRQINILVGAERLYNHHRPLAQRDLDLFLLGKLASGEWTLVYRSGYLRPEYWKTWDETDWYVIHTRPATPGAPHPPIPPLTANTRGLDE